MGRYVCIVRSIWNDDKFPYVTDDCQQVTHHVFTTTYGQNFGLCKVSLYALSDEKTFDTGKFDDESGRPIKKPNHQRYMKAFKEGIANGFFKYCEEHRMLFIPNNFAYNGPNNPNVLKSWAKDFNELPDCHLKNECYESLKGFTEGFGEGFMKVFSDFFIRTLGKDQVKVKEYININPNKEGKKSSDQKIHIDGLEITDSMRTYAAKHGINGHIADVFAKMKQHVIKKGDRLKRTKRQWEAQFETFVDNAPKYNPEFLDSSFIPPAAASRPQKFNSMNVPRPCDCGKNPSCKKCSGTGTWYERVVKPA